MTRTATGERDTVLRLDGITKIFGALVANDAISLTLHRGEILGLLGENGAGKTTLMNILFGHYVADAGSIAVEGRPLPPGDPARVACGRHRHGAPAFHPGREPDRARQHRAGHRKPVAAVLAARRGAQPHPQAGRGLRAGRRSRRDRRFAFGGRAPARRDPQGALPRRPHPHPRRTDRGAHPAGIRGPVRDAQALRGQRPVDHLHFAQAWRGPRRLQPRDDPARRQAGGGSRRGGRHPRRACGTDGGPAHTGSQVGTARAGCGRSPIETSFGGARTPVAARR